MMDREEYERARIERTYAAAEAVGMLSALLYLGDIPNIHMERAQAIVDKWDAETEKMTEAST